MENIHDIAYQNGLTVIETTTNYTGYPENLRPAIIGFKTFEEAQELAKSHGLNVCTFYKKNGWELWYRNGNNTYEPLKPNAEDFGDNFKIYYGTNYKDFDDFYNQEGSFIKDNINNLSFEELQIHLNKLKEVYNEIEFHEQDDLLITDGILFYNFKREVTEYYYDSKTYVIGIIQL